MLTISGLGADEKFTCLDRSKISGKCMVWKKPTDVDDLIEFCLTLDPTACTTASFTVTMQRWTVTDAVTTDRRLELAGRTLLQVRDSQVTVVAADAITRLGTLNPTKAIDYLTQSIERGETESLTVGACIRGIEKLISWNVETNVRNRAVAAVGQVGSVGSTVYGQFAPPAARRIYDAIKQYLGKPAAVEFCAVMPPTPYPQAKDVMELQRILNVLASSYGLRPLAVTGIVDDSTVIAVTTLAARFTTSAKASAVYFEIGKCPTATTVEAYSRVLVKDLTGLARQLGLVYSWTKIAVIVGLTGLALYGSYYFYKRTQ